MDRNRAVSAAETSADATRTRQTLGVKSAALIAFHVAMFLYGFMLVASMTRLVFTLHTVGGRVLAGAIALTVACAMVMVGLNLWRGRRHRVTT